jgi:NADH-quinone oxidoreductase subunit M
MLGLVSATRAGMEGAILQMVNHGVSTGALFLLVGVIYDRRHTRLASDFGGLAKVMPVYTVMFVIVTMASVGVPGTNGFVGEFMVLMGAIVSDALGKYATPQAVGAAFGVVLAAIYMLSVVQKVFFGPLNNPKNEHLEDLNVRETVALAPLIALIFVIGFFPGLFLDRMHDSVSGALERYVDGRKQYLEHRGEQTAVVRALRGGPVERGYPKAPGAEEAQKAAEAAAEQPTEAPQQAPTQPAAPAEGAQP